MWPLMTAWKRRNSPAAILMILSAAPTSRFIVHLLGELCVDDPSIRLSRESVCDIVTKRNRHFHVAEGLPDGYYAVSIPTPDKQDTCVNEAIFCQNNAENHF